MQLCQLPERCKK